MSRQSLDVEDVLFFKAWAANKAVELSTKQKFSALARFSQLVVSYLACLEMVSTIDEGSAWLDRRFSDSRYVIYEMREGDKARDTENELMAILVYISDFCDENNLREIASSVSSLGEHFRIPASWLINHGNT